MSASCGTPPADASVYVYYRARTSHAGQILAALGRHRELLPHAAAGSCPSPIVQRRPSSDPNFETWLERYDGIRPGKLQAVRAHIAQSAQESGLTALAAEGRREECFESVSCV